MLGSRLAFFVGILAIAFVTKPHPSEFAPFMGRWIPDYDFTFSPLVTLITGMINWASVNMELVEFFDGIFFMTASVQTGFKKSYFLGIFNIWIPIPTFVMSWTAQVAKCHYRGIPISSNLCLCLPGWSQSKTCSMFLRRTRTLASVLPALLSSNDLIGPIISNLSIPDGTLIVCVLVYVASFAFRQRYFDRYFVFKPGFFNLDDIVSFFSFHFYHATVFHFLINVTAIWFITVPFYAEVGGTLATQYLLASMLLIPLSRIVLSRVVDDYSLMYGLQYLHLSVTFASLLWPHVSGIGWNNFGRLQKLLFNQALLRNLASRYLTFMMMGNIAYGRTSLLLDLSLLVLSIGTILYIT